MPARRTRARAVFVPVIAYASLLAAFVDRRGAS